MDELVKIAGEYYGAKVASLFFFFATLAAIGKTATTVIDWISKRSRRFKYRTDLADAQESLKQYIEICESNILSSEDKAILLQQMRPFIERVVVNSRNLSELDTKRRTPAAQMILLRIQELLILINKSKYVIIIRATMLTLHAILNTVSAFAFAVTSTMIIGCVYGQFFNTSFAITPGGMDNILSTPIGWITICGSGFILYMLNRFKVSLPGKLLVISQFVYISGLCLGLSVGAKLAWVILHADYSG